MFALILLISIQRLTAIMLPNAVPNIMHARMQRERERERERETERELQVPIVHKPW